MPLRHVSFGDHLKCTVLTHRLYIMVDQQSRDWACGGLWTNQVGHHYWSQVWLLDRAIKPNQDDIYVLSVHPGAVNTAMQQQWKDAYPGLSGKIVTASMLAIGRDVEQGSCSALYAATSPEAEEENWNGYYLSDPGQPGKQSSQASDPQLGAALWELSERLVKYTVGEDALVD